MGASLMPDMSELSKSVEQSLNRLITIAWPIWVSGALILGGKPSWLFDFLHLRPVPERWAPWIGILTLFFFVLWIYEFVWVRWRYRLSEWRRRVWERKGFLRDEDEPG